MTGQNHEPKAALRELAALFLKLGATSFGGPLAHIARMEDEVVTRRGWLDRQQFVDLIGAVNLIPGPNSTELAMHIGQRRAGSAGLVVAGVAFITPAALMVLALAWLYERYGTLPQARWLLYGVQPVVLAIIAQALSKFFPTAFKNRFTAAVALVAAALVVAGADEVAVIAGAALVGLLAGRGSSNLTPGPFPKREGEPNSSSSARPEVSDRATALASSPPSLAGKGPGVRLGAPLLATGALAAAPPLWKLFLVFLKIGSVIYGSGYVLLAFLRADLVERYGWLSDRQLIDAIAVGQITPGPVFTTATFAGYQIAGWGGAAVATLGIFLPSFVFVGLLSLLLDRLREAPALRTFLDAVNAASLALMGVVTGQLLWVWVVQPARGGDAVPTVLMVVALAVLLRTKINSVWLLAAGALAGWLLRGGHVH